MKCCRCLNDIIKDDSLGGTYGGVVCKHHRSCQNCWWDPHIISGQRKNEPEKTKYIPLVNSPRKGEHIECYGCFYLLVLE